MNQTVIALGFFDGVHRGHGALLEKAVGTSRGILTAPETGAATATEIRAANHDTFALVSAIRRMWEAALGDMAYAADVL